MPWALLSSVLYGASFPGTAFSLAVFVSLVPLFIALARSSGNREAFARGALFGALHSTIIAYWIFNALYFHYRVNIALSLLFLLGTVTLPLGALFGLFALAYRFLYREHVLFHALVAPSLWVLFEFLRDIVPFFLPWGMAGYALAGFPRLIQAADVAGPYGISWFVVFVNSMAALALGRALSESGGGGMMKTAAALARQRLPILAALAVVALALVYGSVQTSRWRGMADEAARERGLAVRVVQGNFTQRDRWDNRSVFDILEKSLKLTGSVRESASRTLVVWPETVLNAGGSLRDAILARLLREIGPGSLLVFGGTRRDRGAEYNSAYFLSGNGAIKAYDKTILLPFAETTPWGINLLGAFYEAPARFDAGRLPPHAELEGVRLGFSICFEKIYAWFVRRQARSGAEALINISNDSWFGRSSNPYQSLDMGIMRAVENRRYMVIASNSGISAVVTPWGECAARSGLFTEERLDARIGLISARSVYTVIGDAILYAAIAAVFAAMGAAIVKK